MAAEKVKTAGRAKTAAKKRSAAAKHMAKAAETKPRSRKKQAAGRGADKLRGRKAVSREVTEPPAVPAMSREALIPALWEKALQGSVSAIEMLRKLDLLNDAKSSEGEEVLLHLVERLLSEPGLCEADEDGVNRRQRGARGEDA